MNRSPRYSSGMQPHCNHDRAIESDMAIRLTERRYHLAQVANGKSTDRRYSQKTVGDRLGVSQTGGNFDGGSRIILLGAP